MKPCTHHEDLVRAIRAGHWPEAASQELRTHVTACARCTEEARLGTAFATARTAAMRTLVPQSPALLWWKAQLRQRHRAMEQVQRPASVLPVATGAASLLVLCVLLGFAWKGMGWQDVLTYSAGWKTWMTVAALSVLGCIAAAATVLSLDRAD